MLDRLESLTGTRLNLSDYASDFDAHFSELTGADALKLERRQSFHQPENKSWRTFRAGDVNESLRLLEDDRPALVDFFGALAARNAQVRRVRVVERPLTPYLYWELHSLHIRAQCGERTRVICADALTHLENQEIVPEVVTLGRQVTYRIHYDDQGVLAGAVRHLDPQTTTACATQIQDLYQQGEPIDAYFAREIAPH